VKSLILLRGIPGSGKSTLAKVIEDFSNVAADDYPGLYNDGKIDFSKLADAHKWCADVVEEFMKNDRDTIVVHNTFVKEWEMDRYFKLAEKYGYVVFSAIVENRHGNKSEHNVPIETVNRMVEKFEISL